MASTSLLGGDGGGDGGGGEGGGGGGGGGDGNGRKSGCAKALTWSRWLRKSPTGPWALGACMRGEAAGGSCF